MPRRVEKVVAIADHDRAERQRQAAAFCAGMVKADPTLEIRAGVDAEFDRDSDVCRRFGDLQAQAQDLAFKDFYLGYVTKEAVRRQAEDLKARLGHADASPIERMMIEHAVLCHVRLGMVEHLYSRNSSTRMDIVEHWEKRLTLAQRRFTRAVTTLARLRGLLARADAAKEAAARARGGRTLAILKQMTG